MMCTTMFTTNRLSFLAVLLLMLQTVSSAAYLRSNERRHLQECMTPEEFAASCEEALTSDAVVSDAISSQMEFAAFLNGLSGDPNNTEFYSLPISLQLYYVESVCDHLGEKQTNDIEVIECQASLLSAGQTGEEFGYVFNQSGVDAEAEIQEFCSEELYNLTIREGMMPSCSDVPDGNETDTTGGTSSNETDVNTPPIIPEVAGGIEDVSILVELLTQANLTGTLSGEGPFTVFAPNNDAFEALPEGAIETLRANPEELTAVLTYHVVAGETLLSRDLMDGQELATVEGSNVTITKEGESTAVNGIPIIAADIPALNGVIHVISGVLIPPHAGDDGNETDVSDGPQTNQTEVNTPPIIPEVAGGIEDVSILVELLTQANLTGTLSGEGPFTVFAPNNDAFEALPNGTIETLRANPEELTAVLTYHVVAGETLLSRDLMDGQELTTVEGSNVTITKEGESTAVNGIPIIAADIPALNGVIHIISGVLIPPHAGDDGNETDVSDGPQTNQTEVNTPPIIPEVAGGIEDVSILVELLTQANLTGTLSGEGPFTVFAPNNDAFEALPNGTIETLRANPEELTAVLTYHVVAGETLLSRDLMDGQELTTVEGSNVTITKEGESTAVNGIPIIAADIPALNGVIHVISGVLIPPHAGDDGNETDVSDGPQTNQTEVNTPPIIPEVAGGIEDVSILVELLTQANLTGTLSGEGPFTVFAPNNDAFEALPNVTIETLRANPEELTAVLTYHVVAGETLLSRDLMDGQELTTVEGSNVTITKEGGSTAVNRIPIIAADIPALNGVIHVISGVLIPPGAGDDGNETDVSDGPQNETDVNTPPKIPEVAGGIEDVSILVELLTQANLTGTLSGEGPFTVFAPNNDAFEALPNVTIETLRANPEELTAVLTYHVVAGETLLSRDLMDGQELTTVEGSNVTITKEGGSTAVNGIPIIAADIPALNGVIHIISGVLMPPDAGVPPMDEPFDSPSDSLNSSAVPAGASP